MQNCDKAGIILKVRKYISKALTSEPREIKASSQSAFSPTAGRTIYLNHKSKIWSVHSVLLVDVLKHRLNSTEGFYCSCTYYGRYNGVTVMCNKLIIDMRDDM